MAFSIPIVFFIIEITGEAAFVVQDPLEEMVQGLMLEAVVKDSRISEVKQIPTQMTPTFQPRI